MFARDSKQKTASVIVMLGAVFFIVTFMGQSGFARQRARTTNTAGQGKTVSANSFPGQDIGAKITAADKALGAAPGEITASGGGTIATQIVISAGHTLRLGPGTYVSKTTLIPIVMRENSSLIGAGWDNTIVLESTAKDQYTVISAYNHAVENGSADSGITIRELQVKGANPGFNSAPQAVSLGNCSNCSVDKVWINGTRSIGMQLGGSSRKGFFANNSKITNCLFTRVASQNLALVNGKNILFENNRFMTSGQVGGPGNTNIDLEVNEGEDHLENVIIRNNLIDVRNSEVSPTGNGIVVNSTSGTPYVGPIVIEKNTIIGGETPPGVPTNVLSNGIYIFGTTMRDVTIRDNTIRRTGQSGIRIEGTHIVVSNNQLFDVGGGGTNGFVVQATNSQIINNTFQYSGQGPADDNIVVLPGSSNNVFQNNRGWNVRGVVR
ncbi:MAG TPA: right-handed parallel beta-helix repeat-containing protein [Pyrinomonadaceae bacterium]|nr:right-handed parallel beta-helix repeat-containing protein [Pyrinomonadaceae bacterium]